MMQMIGCLLAMLITIRDTILALMTDARQEADSDEGPYIQLVAWRKVWTKFDHPTDTFVPSDMWQLDVRDWVAISSSGGSSFRMKVWKRQSGYLLIVRGFITDHFDKRQCTRPLQALHRHWEG
jgi:hypothetical protein